MVTLAFVNIWGHRAGVVMWNENTTTAVFEYDPAFERLGLDLSPLLMPMPYHGHIIQKGNGHHSTRCQSTTSGQISQWVIFWL